MRGLEQEPKSKQEPQKSHASFITALLTGDIGSFLPVKIYQLEHERNLCGKLFCPHAKLSVRQIPISNDSQVTINVTVPLSLYTEAAYQVLKQTEQ